MTNREKDARLHELLFGVTTGLRWCQINWFDCGAWQEFESGFPHYDQQMMAEKFSPNKDHARQPCFLIRAATPDNGIADYGVVPHYSQDIAAAFEAESKLPKDTQSYYLECLSYAVGLEFENGHVDSVATQWKTRRATPEQMVGAMLAVLEPVAK